MMVRVVRSALVLTAVGLVFAASVNAADKAKETSKEQTEVTKTAISGAELFAREWLPNDPRSHGGDGLGPVFNDSSCIACHNQAGAGGGGPRSKNVDIVSAFLNGGAQFAAPRRSLMTEAFRTVLGLPSGRTPVDPKVQKQRLARRREQLVAEAKKLHPGFTTARSVVVHLFGTEDNYTNWRSKMLATNQFVGRFGMPPQIEMQDTVESALAHDHAHGDVAVRAVKTATKPAALRAADLRKAQLHIQRHRQAVQTNVPASFPRHHGSFTLTTTERNATALFGAGLLNSVSDAAIEAAAKKTYKAYPGVSGRVCKLPGGKIGRFGWKSQKANLRDFAMTACAVELGLNVPDHAQAGLPSDPSYSPKGFDMNQAECDALVDYLTKLAAPKQAKTNSDVEAKYIGEGKALFGQVGCAVCHTESIGDVTAVYSDLLLHDMGADLADTGDYGVFVPDSPGGEAEGVVPDLAQLMKPKTTSNLVPAGARKEDLSKTLGATRNEWRTAPLWGVRDSAPYLHDGRADNIEQAVAFHGGEGLKSSQQFFALSSKDRMKVIAFLKTLIAPEQVAAK